MRRAATASWLALAGLAFVLALGPQGCSWFRKSKTSEETRLPTPDLGVGAVSESSSGSEGTGLEVERDRMPENPDILSNVDLKIVYFDFDKSDIRSDQRANLDANVQWVKGHPGVKVLLEGHCDERGTNEYNLALGERRADSVKSYLTQAGIDRESINVISYGEERPADSGQGEGAWAQNRRVVFMPFK